MTKGAYSIKLKSNEEKIIREIISSINNLVVRDDFEKRFNVSKKLGEGSFSVVHLVTKIQKPASIDKPIKRFAVKMLCKL